MRLQTITYREMIGSPQEWALDGLTLFDRNLIVGKNASGKSRTIGVINSIAAHFIGWLLPGLSTSYDVVFTHEGKSLRYELECEQYQVIAERFTVDEAVLLERGEGGKGFIKYEKIGDGERIEFQTPTNELAVVARRDNIQHPFLEPLHAWGSSVRLFQFGTPLGKHLFARRTDMEGAQANESNPDEVVARYQQGTDKFGSQFSNAVMNDMNDIGYEIENIDIEVPLRLQFERRNIYSDIVSLSVKERDLAGITDQESMSQGMFRALSILVQVNYSQMAQKATCILIDDIGEGLDFDRSCRLINILREKAQESNIQLILSTNDRFVMNEVPLDEWSVLQREGSRVRVRNYENSRDIFEDFRFTGLSNFSFLEMDFINEPLKEIAIHE